MGMIKDELMTALDELLSEGRDGAVEREKTEFDRIAGPYAETLVLFGAGGLGRRTLARLRRIGIEPLAFVDNSPTLQGTSVNGLQVLSPEEGCARWGKSAVFVITAWFGEGTDRMWMRERFLRELGCERVVTFGPLYWKYPELCIPHYAAGQARGVHEQREAVKTAAENWADDASRAEYLGQIKWRLFYDFAALPSPVKHTIYFPDDICPLIADEVFVDCGAYDGDTIASFIDQPQPGFKRIIAFEPDPGSWKKLISKVDSLPQKDSIELHKTATGATKCTVKFSADGTPGAAVGSGDLEVECVTLDETLKDVHPTYIKMDIEGAEPDTIIGARGLIQEHKPVLAICSYHLQDHVWKIPNLIRSIDPGYSFFLRPHLSDVWDLVTYAIPEGRLRR